jgi:hypothetical protein
VWLTRATNYGNPPTLWYNFEVDWNAMFGAGTFQQSLT